MTDTAILILKSDYRHICYFEEHLYFVLKLFRLPETIIHYRFNCKLCEIDSKVNCMRLTFPSQS